MTTELTSLPMTIYSCKLLGSRNLCEYKGKMVPNGGSVELGVRFCEQPSETFNKEYIRCDKRNIIENIVKHQEIKS